MALLAVPPYGYPNSSQTRSDCSLFYKQTKSRNETGSNLSLGTRLTVLSKRLGRKRCCDTTPNRYLEVCRLTIFASHCKKMIRLLPKTEGFGEIPGPEAYQIKNEYAQRQRLRPRCFQGTVKPVSRKRIDVGRIHFSFGTLQALGSHQNPRSLIGDDTFF